MGSSNLVLEGSNLAEVLLDMGIELWERLDLVQLRLQLLVEEHNPAKVAKHIKAPQAHLNLYPSRSKCLQKSRSVYVLLFMTVNR